MVQFYCFLLFDDEFVGINVVIGRCVQKFLEFDIFFCVLDMSFGVFLEEVKVVFVMGVEKVGIGICLGEGGFFDEECYVNL